MGITASVELELEHTPAHLVGGPGQYLSRPGFWHGGAGIAAAWYGAASAVASHLHARAQQAAPDPIRLAQLGQIDCALRCAGALLREGARLLQDIDSVAHRVRRVATGWEPQLTIVTDGALARGPLFDLVEAFYALAPPTRLKLREGILSGTLEVLSSGRA
ncbi:MAG: hypothetical protein RSF79_30410, partial [Janthinobacterium sp.]